MSEFKFACPVCGQHITADSSTSGSAITCPTCFQKIVVPQAPASADPKFIVTATQVGKPRPTPTDLGSTEPVRVSTSRSSLIATGALIVLLGALGVGLWKFRARLFGTSQKNIDSKEMARKDPPPRVYPIPTNIVWTMELAKAGFPEDPAAGSVHGMGFFCERATLQGGNLTLRQGRKGPPDLGISVEFHVHQGEELSGKTVEIPPDREPPAGGRLPRVTLRWKDEAQKAVNEKIDSGYGLKVAFGTAANGRMPGKIYIALPDDTKSVVAGTFYAEIRKPPQPKQPARQNKPSG